MRNYINKLPGSLNKEQLIDQVIRVNQAGEYGAKRIYEGQVDALKLRNANLKDINLIKHMAAQEVAHLAYFNEQIVQREVRPTLLFPLWHLSGYALGFITGILGTKTAMVCTEAVEEVIDEHYEAQLAILEDDEQDLKDNISKFREEEIEHKNIAAQVNLESNIMHTALNNIIKVGCKTAIWLAKKL